MNLNGYDDCDSSDALATSLVFFLHAQTDLPFSTHAHAGRLSLGDSSNACIAWTIFRLTFANMQYPVSPIEIVCVDRRSFLKTRLTTKTLISDQESQDWSLDRPSWRCLSLGYSLPYTSFSQILLQQDRPVPPKLSDDWGPCAWTW